ncbi:hypothetical protein L1887_30080 [Cichorium endivia]|nr:hypothetical protein L1887_30080 [Cichorium endivia]
MSASNPRDRTKSLGVHNPMRVSLTHFDLNHGVPWTGGREEGRKRCRRRHRLRSISEVRRLRDDSMDTSTTVSFGFLESFIQHHHRRDLDSLHSLRQTESQQRDQIMDHRFSKHDTDVAIKSTRGLLSSKPYEPYPICSTCSKNNGIEREASSGPKLIEIMKQKLSHGAKMIQLGSPGKIFKKTFGIREEEKLLQASPCYLYTTAGAIAGILFVSTERVAFCSDRSIKTYSSTGKLLKFQYKVSIPLGKINGVRESLSMKRPSNNYVELVTVDDFNFWFLGFVKYKKTLRYLHHAIGFKCLSNRC